MIKRLLFNIIDWKSLFKLLGLWIFVFEEGNQLEETYFCVDMT